MAKAQGQATIRLGNVLFRWLMDHAQDEAEVFVTTAFELSKYCASTWARGDVSDEMLASSLQEIVAGMLRSSP